ncbi:MAG TPA: sigma 54-interacting transcriptional regulator [Bacteroidota bacterium]|nr:sigma 54-interacting transcriptional regulator [Bacteroidota bacterium]
MPDYLIGRSPVIKRIRASLEKYAGHTSPLIIIGEPGVGKSLLASRIHANSLLKDHELETVNFKILSERDQRIRLLGGSPPELPTTRRSVLELPTTVVLKHLDKASRFLQDRLVEAIFKKTIARLGTKEQRPIRCRMIFVFNEFPLINLKAGCISQALYKYLSKYPCIEIPPLKKRKEDIPELAQHFFTQFQIQRYRKIDQRFMELLLEHRWETNILDLKAFVKSLKVFPDKIAIQQRERIELAKINLMIDEGREFSLKYSLSMIEKEIVRVAMVKYDDSQSDAAKSVGLTDRSIRNILR